MASQGLTDDMLEEVINYKLIQRPPPLIHKYQELLQKFDSFTEEQCSNKVEELIEEIENMEYKLKKMEVLFNMRGEDAKYHAQINQEINEEIQKSKSKMIDLQNQLDNEKRIKQYKSEFETIAKTINHYPSQSESIAKIEECKREATTYEEKSKSEEITQKRKQVHLLVSIIQDLKNESIYDQIMKIDQNKQMDGAEDDQMIIDRRMSLKKLKDKVVIDGQIDYVNMAFPDQYGRLQGFKMNSEHFIDTIEGNQNKSTFFELNENPFKKDIEGKDIKFGDDIKIPDTLLLKPDLQTLRDATWLKNEAFVLADVYDPNEEPLKIAPRNILKELISQLSTDITTQVKFSFALNKMHRDPKDKEPHPQSHKGMLTYANYGEIMNDFTRALLSVGIPIQQQIQTHNEHQYKLSFMEIKNDLLTQCDIFHIAKHAIKHIAYANNYEISFIPINMSGITNELVIWLKGYDIKPNQLQNTFFFAPNLNSFRRLKGKEMKDVLRLKSDGTNMISISAPDINLYLSLTSLLNTAPKDEETVLKFRTYAESMGAFDENTENVFSKEAHQYYKRLFMHELEEYEENFNSNNKHEYKQLLLIGLDYSGKTTMIKRFKQIPENSAEYFYTTPYLNIEKITLPFSNMPCVVYDLSGQGRYRENWSFFYPDVDGIFFVVDTADRERLSVVQEILLEMAKHPGLRDRHIPFVILANKQDSDEAIDELMLRKVLQIDQLKTINHIKYYVKNTIGLTGQGISECFQLFEEKQ